MMLMNDELAYNIANSFGNADNIMPTMMMMMRTYQGYPTMVISLSLSILNTLK